MSEYDYTIGLPAEVPGLSDEDLATNARAALARNVWSPIAKALLTEVVARFARAQLERDILPAQAHHGDSA